MPPARDPVGSPAYPSGKGPAPHHRGVDPFFLFLLLVALAAPFCPRVRALVEPYRI